MVFTAAGGHLDSLPLGSPTTGGKPETGHLLPIRRLLNEQHEHYEAMFDRLIIDVTLARSERSAPITATSARRCAS